MTNSKRVSQDLSQVLLELFKHGISNVQPKNILKNFLKIKDGEVIIYDEPEIITYSAIKKIIPICIGKASVDMAKTVKSIFRNLKCKISEGIIVVNKENYEEVLGFKCFISGHPIPDKNGLMASKFIEKILSTSKKDDLVLVFLSGGGSALLTYPVENINLTEKIKLNKFLLESGADIKEINTVRKHLSKIKGGNFLKMSSPSKVHCLILSDVVGDDLSSIASGPTVPDKTSFEDVEKILKKYKIWKELPFSIRKYIERGLNDKELETPGVKNHLFSNVKNTLIGSNFLCLKSINDLCKTRNIKSKIWKKNIEGDVVELAQKFVRDLKKENFAKPFLLISGGESTVKIKGTGKGGRNQEFSLHFLNCINKLMPKLKFTLLSVGTDGRDGPTDAAGAIVNHNSLDLIKDKKIDINKELNNNNSYDVLKKINSLVIIDGTNTNVADLQLLMLN